MASKESKLWQHGQNVTDMHRYPRFKQVQVRLAKICERGSDLHASNCTVLSTRQPPKIHQLLRILAKQITSARRHGGAAILVVGGHPIKLGLSRFLIDLIERGLVTHVATNGSGIIHDFELAYFGETSEDVAKWIQVGQFGLWHETSRLNDIIREGARRGEGLGEAVGRTIEEEKFPHGDLSIAAAGWRCGVPVTCHVTIGADIIHAHPNCDGAALGQTSYADFLIFARSIQDLEGGVFLNLGSAVTGPEVYLKALSMARNVARQDGREIKNFTTAVFDIVPLPENWRESTPSKDDPFYYYRPWKTILVRTVQDAPGAQSFYIRGDHRDTIPALWQELVSLTDPGFFSPGEPDPTIG